MQDTHIPYLYLRVSCIEAASSCEVLPCGTNPRGCFPYHYSLNRFMSRVNCYLRRLSIETMVNLTVKKEKWQQETTLVSFVIPIFIKLRR